MNKLPIDNINIYKSFKKSSYTIESAIAEFVDNSIKAFDFPSQDNTIIIYWNCDENWLQIIDNGNGIDKESVNNLFKLFTNPTNFGIGMKAAAFFLGNKLTIESKNTNQNFAFKTQLNLSSNDDFAPILYVKPDEILRSFNSATRITIDELDKRLSNEHLKMLYWNLSKLFKKYLQKNVNIIVAIIKNNTIYDISNDELIAVPSLNQVKKLIFKLPEHNESLTTSIDEVININNKTINIKGHAYKFLMDNVFNGIIISNEQRTIIGSNKLYKPKWFNHNFRNVLIDIELNNVETNITKNWFNWDEDTQNKIDEFIFEKVKHLQTKEIKKTKSLVDKEQTRKLFISDETEQEHLETSKLYLTKALSTDENNYVNDFEIIKDKLHFTYNCDDGKKILIHLNRKKDKNQTDWLQLISITEQEVEQHYEYEVIYNVSHPFFKPFDNDKNFSHRMEHFIIAYAISETICRLDGLNVNDLKYEIGKLLKGMDDDF